MNLSIKENAYSCLEGKNGELIYWNLDPDGTMTFRGNGRIPDFDCGSNPLPPWQTQKSSITSLIFLNGITEIGIKAFENCINLHSVTLPESLWRIHADCFRGCSRLENLVTAEPQKFRHIYELEPNALRNRKFSRNNRPAGILFGLHAFTGTPWARNKWGDFYLSHTPDGVTLTDCLLETEQITIPGNINKIGSFAFSGLPVSSVILCEGIEEIMEYAFRKTSITEIRIPKSIKKIGGSAFACSPLSLAEFPPASSPAALLDPDAFRETRISFKGGKKKQFPELYRLIRKKEKGIRTCDRLLMEKKSQIAGVPILDAAGSILRRIKHGSLVIGICCEKETKYVQRLEKYSWDSYFETILVSILTYYCSEIDENGEPVWDIWRESSYFIDDYILLTSFCTSYPEEKIPSGSIRPCDDDMIQEWFCRGGAYTEKYPEMILLQEWLKKHPDYQLPPEEYLNKMQESQQNSFLSGLGTGGILII